MLKKEAEDTPLMKQFKEIKLQHPDAILLFRVGDFYETYSNDAIKASEVLGITLTHKSNGAAGKMEMAGFPYHAIDTYLPKLIRAGMRVAVCDQLEDPKLAKKLVKRGITELVTPGISFNDNILNYKENNFLAAVHFDNKNLGVAFLDISTGEFLTAEGSVDYMEKLINNFGPKEVLYERTKRELFKQYFGDKYITFEQDDWVYTYDAAMTRLLKHFETNNLKGFGVEKLKLGIIASGAVLYYLDHTHHEHISNITALRRIEEDRFVWLDNFTINNLELYNSQNENAKTLLNVLDKTTCPMGARLLKRWISFPLKNVKLIKERQNVVKCFDEDFEMCQIIEQNLSCMGDLERIITKAAVGRISPREMVQLKIALKALKPIKELCEKSKEESLHNIGEQINLCTSISQRIEDEMEDNPPILISKGRVIRDGFNEELDELRKISYNGKDYLLQIQQREAKATGIPSLKIGFNNVFGYFIEVRNSYKEKVPETWIRKQTLVNAERYITQELKDYEEKILGAEDKILTLESSLFSNLVTALTDYIPIIQLNSTLVAKIDCLLSFSKVGRANGYVCPDVNDTDIIDIIAGRHPVIEQQLPTGESYIANDVYLDSETQQIIIITGPNMAGKSALLRQTALIVIMAQIGCFVPANVAKIGVVDKIFTRVGASDNISMGESTFMVEMNEAASILNNMSSHSLILFDELGRGTSTYDGISIAWAIVEYIHNNPKARAKTLFATHYHELNEMEKIFERIKNYNVQVKEVDNKVVFLRKLVRGGCEHSFGIHVAKMAGMPKAIVNRANVILKQLEKENSNTGLTVKEIGGNDGSKTEHNNSNQGYQMSLFQLNDPILENIRDQILDIDLNNLTPIEALNKLNDIKRILTGKNE